MAMNEEMKSLQKNQTWDSSIRVLLALVATFDMELEQLDVKTTFLHGKSEEDILMKQPKGFEVQGKKDCL